MEQTRKQRQSRSDTQGRRRPAGQSSRVVEVGWFVLTLALFVLMGPFAAPVALFAVLGLPPEQRGESEPELLSKPVRYQFR